MKIIMTTSNDYHHILPVSIYLLNKNWPNQEIELVGYTKPNYELPSNFTFHSLGEQIGGPENFSTDLRPYFEKQDPYFIWLFEDTFIKKINSIRFNILESLLWLGDRIGRINLSNETIKQNHTFYLNVDGEDMYENTQTANYRLSTQPSIWNRDFLLQYLIPGLTPWKFETQSSINDGWKILGLKNPAVYHNEGVRKFDIFKYDLNGVDPDQIQEMKKLNIL